MKWKVLPLLLIVLFVFAACSRPASTSPAEDQQSTQEVMAPEAVQEGDSAEAGTQTQPVVTVYKSPTCGCCSEWVEHMEEAGFVVEAHDVNDLATVKKENHVPGGLQSCHTAIVDGYVIEGHVPAEDISQLLAERPNVAGLAVPGMPVGSPGMEIDGNPGQPFDVISFDVDGNMDVFASHNE